MLSSRVLNIRVSGKERKEKVRKLLFDLAHFKNLWILLIKRYKELYGYYPTDQSILYGLIADREHSPRKEEKLERFNEVKENILKDGKLKEFLTALKEQKRKIDNNYLLQQIIRDLIRNFKSYREAYKEYLQIPEKFRRAPRPPKQKRLKFLMNFSVELNVNVFKRLNDALLIRLRTKGKEFLKIKLPKSFNYEIKSVKLKLLGTDVYADVVYRIELPEPSTIKNYTAGIDLGLNNLIALVSTNPELKSIIVSGKEIKAFNQWFNKEKARLQSEIDTLKSKEKLIRLRELSAYRKRKIDNDFHKISGKIVDILSATNHKKLYIGKGATESKDGINIGRKNNQHFVSIPFKRLIELIKYKAKEAGIEVEEKNEAFTSKTSPFADIFETRKVGYEYLKAKKEKNKNLIKELLKKIREHRQAVRQYRGLVKDVCLNKIFNADLVGAYNILRVGENSLRLIEDLKILFVKLCNPVKFKLIDFLYKVSPNPLQVGSSSSLLGRVDSFDYQLCGNVATS